MVFTPNERWFLDSHLPRMCDDSSPKKASNVTRALNSRPLRARSKVLPTMDDPKFCPHNPPGTLNKQLPKSLDGQSRFYGQQKTQIKFSWQQDISKCPSRTKTDKKMVKFEAFFLVACKCFKLILVILQDWAHQKKKISLCQALGNWNKMF